MRVGMNPQKAEKKLTMTTHFRVIVVVYIPNEEGFYAHMLDVFKTCLDSLVSTVNSNGAITVVNNGSYGKVTNLLQEYFEQKKIDSVIHHATNIGKIDALIGAARGTREQFITLTDADVLFVKGWQEKTEEVFATFDNVGAVSPIPVKMGLFYGTASVLKQIVLKRIKFKFTDIPENFDAYNRYLESINWPAETLPGKKWPVIESKGLKAMVGSGHQVLTMHRDIFFKSVPTNPSLTLVGGNSEYTYVDLSIDLAGKLRLATYHNYAFHMGNKLETWMSDIQHANETAPKQPAAALIPQQNKDLLGSVTRMKLYVFNKRWAKKIFSSLYQK